MKLPIVYYGDPVLRKKASPVTEFTPEVKQLIQDLLETREAHNGFGLAAPQVGHSLAIFVANMIEPDESSYYKDGRIRVFINPKLSNPSSEKWTYEEGCLSLPGLYVDVIRPNKITVSALDEEGKLFTEEFTGWHARIIMHENDHLNGVLTIDRIDPKGRRSIEAQLKKLKQKYNP